MSYSLGVDIGTTFSAAAVAVGGRAEIVQLGENAAAIPSVVFLHRDGTVLIGDAAVRRAGPEPDRAAQEFKRRIGDPTPILLGGTPYAADVLTARLLESILSRVAQEQGERPAVTVVGHPAAYGEYKLEFLRSAAALAGVDDLEPLPEPVAAAVHYAQSERLAIGDRIGVYDFGGGTFDAAVIEKTSEDEWRILGEPQGIERLGGVDLDEAVLGHVRRALGDRMAALDPDDPSVRAALGGLRDEARRGKEALSSDTEATIRVLLPGLHTEVRLTRPELEAMARPRLEETIVALGRAVETAGLGFEALSRILLVGGSSRMPLVAEMVRERTQRPVAMDAQPKHAVALGAARHGLRRLSTVGPARKTAPSSATRAVAARRSARIPAAIALATVLAGLLVVAALALDVPGRLGIAAADPSPTPPSSPGPADETPRSSSVAGSATPPAPRSPKPTIDVIVPPPAGYRTILDDSGRLSLNAPGTWAHVTATPLETELGGFPSLGAAVDLESFYDYEQSGVYVIAVPTALLAGRTDSETIDGIWGEDQNTLCTFVESAPLDIGGRTGLLKFFDDCGASRLQLTLAAFRLEWAPDMTLVVGIGAGSDWSEPAAIVGSQILMSIDYHAD